MNRDLTTGKPEKVLFQFCLPLFGSIIFQQLYNIADSFVAGKFISDNVEATSFAGDGVIVCTPTGSTAYSMSAGGPIVEPSARDLLITPICAHAILAKSIVVSPERVISLKVGKLGRHNAYLSVDGGRPFRLNPGDVVTTKTSTKVTRLVRLKQTSFFEILSKKFIDRQR